MDKKTKLFCFFVIFWVIAQIICLIFYWNVNQTFDSFYYIPQARYHAELGMPYPTVHNLFDKYLQSPGYINMLAISFALTGSYKPILIIGILMNLGILLNIYYLTKTLFDRATAILASIIYCIIPTNVFIPIWLTTELPYVFLGITALNLSFRHNVKILVFAGFIYALAQTIRPIVIAFLICSLVFFLIHHYSFRKYLAIIVPYVLLLFFNGLYVKKQTGYFVTSSTVAGYDLMYTSYDGANGGQHPWYVFNVDGPGYIENESHVDFVKKDSIWKHRSIDWIKDHPMRYLGLCIKRPFIMYKSDIWDIPFLMRNTSSATFRFIEKLLVNIPYYLVLILAIISLFIGLRHYISEKGIPFLYLVLGTGATCLFGMEVRYHYPYVFVLAIMAAFCIMLIQNKFLKSKQI